MKSTSGLSIWPRNCRAYAESDSTYRRWPSAKMVSKARLDLPDPDSPVKTIRESRGRSSDTSLRLCSRAPRTTRRSATAFCSLGPLGTPPTMDTSWYPGVLTKTGCRRFPPLPPGPESAGCPLSLPCRARGWSRIQQVGRPHGRAREHRMDDEVRRSMARIGEATDRLLASAAALSDAGVREPSLLPGWTRGHVLTHIARNGDGLGNLLRWARTGITTPMYASREARRADIEAGAGRSAADLAADVQATAIAFAAEAASLPDEAWAAQVQALTGPAIPALRVLDWRWREVEIHHVDLGTGYRPDDWPGEFVNASLPGVAGEFAGREDAPSCLLQPDGSGLGPLQIGPEQPAPQPVLVHGPPASLLAWLIGRDGGSGLRVSPEGGVLPVLPPWR